MLNLCYTGIKSLPESISRLENLKSIDLSACDELQGFPDGFFQLTQLEELLLYSTELYSDEIGSLKKLKKLSLSGDLYEIPVWIFDLKELTELCLNEVALSEIPSEIGELTKLEYLDLGVNERITKLPESFGNLTNLKHLSLICCSLQSLPESFVNLTQLEELELGPSDMNTLDRLSHGVTEFLTQLGDTVSGWEKKEPAEPWMLELWDWADKSRISEYDIPREVESLQNPYAIILDNLTAKKLSAFFNKFAQLKNLDILHINLKDSLSNTPNELGNFSNLKSLTISGFGLTSLPETIGNLENLTSLHIGGNQLTSLPDSIANLENLTSLDISFSELTSLPETIGNLENLTDLIISGNQLTSLPESIGNLKKLTRLETWNNQLTLLPETIGNLENLTY
ncbi:leucine-rich repeat domain-containing protein, partial [Psychrobacter sp. AOP42-A1-21]|uniref:leucine-rich repeat domain-containing protein n=1 Tax=Psychrobacter sp. AOP42-A1-21 TaxID=3457675 RepID=UPI0040375E45